ncbi:MAG TPA: ATP synthase F1 subunit epsilon [Thermoleophilaceae bacterium]|nr:ATP synthase F1 subunit epsilon [Thermoleophilaceae bacterium]
MAHTKFECQVLTPEGEAFTGEVEMVSTRTGVGSLGILANHAPLMGMLEPTELRLYKTESDIVRFAQSEGYLQMADNQCLLLVEDAIPPDQLDRSDIEEKLRACEQEAEHAEEGSEERERHHRDARRWRAFLDIASST